MAVLPSHLSKYLESLGSSITNLRGVLYLQTRKPHLHCLGSLISGQDAAARAGERPRQLAEVGLLGLAEVGMAPGDGQRHCRPRERSEDWRGQYMYSNFTQINR